MWRWVPPIAVPSAPPMTFAFSSAQSYAGDTLPSALITALFEVLSFPALMDDLKINQALEAALLHLKQSHELALTDGGRYQGLYRLMAHPSPQIRAMVSVLDGPIAVCQVCQFVLLDSMHTKEPFIKQHPCSTFHDSCMSLAEIPQEGGRKELPKSSMTKQILQTPFVAQHNPHRVL